MKKHRFFKKRLKIAAGVFVTIFFAVLGTRLFWGEQAMIFASALSQQNQESTQAVQSVVDDNLPAKSQQAVFTQEGSPDVSTHSLGAKEKIGVPVRIEIPSIALDAAIEKVALTKGRTLDVPKHPFDTGWYDLGPRPGQKGSAVIDGHVNWMYGATAVFADLHKLKPGDKITVQDDKGALITFVVRESRSYAASAHAADVFRSNDGKAHLNIITCDGVWDKRAQQYSKRLVVFADKE